MFFRSVKSIALTTVSSGILFLMYFYIWNCQRAWNLWRSNPLSRVKINPLCLFMGVISIVRWYEALFWSKSLVHDITSRWGYLTQKQGNASSRISRMICSLVIWRICLYTVAVCLLPLGLCYPPVQLKQTVVGWCIRIRSCDWRRQTKCSGFIQLFTWHRWEIS